MVFAKTILGKTYDPNYVGIPEGLPGLEFEIWQRWREFARKGAIKVWFDVKLGAGQRTKRITTRSWPVGNASKTGEVRRNKETRPHQIVNYWVPDTQIRAHIVIEYAHTVWIVEIRPFANSNSIGRLLTQKRLWTKDNPIPSKKVEMVIVTNMVDDDTSDTCQDLEIKYFVV